MRQQFKEFGVSVDVGSEETQEHIPIMAANWPSLEAFLACSTQWRVTAVVMGAASAMTSQLIWIGLDYASCDVVLRSRNAPPHTLSDIMVMEEAALPILNEVD